MSGVLRALLPKTTADAVRVYALMTLMAPYEGAGKVVSVEQVYFALHGEAMPKDAPKVTPIPIPRRPHQPRVGRNPFSPMSTQDGPVMAGDCTCGEPNDHHPVSCGIWWN